MEIVMNGREYRVHYPIITTFPDFLASQRALVKPIGIISPSSFIYLELLGHKRAMLRTPPRATRCSESLTVKGWWISGNENLFYSFAVFITVST